ncbi:bombyxin B-9-like [Ostrinia furnacalis]|uniref:bombyxin B-9-like n=1 Tax=Ostrinia furnacalis TaxID=93504 RepID=UPI00103DEB82|nr:bombyxin B-9-like [Ostrinia furnacalis]
MKSWQLFLLTLLLVLATVKSYESNPEKYCGRRLAQVMAAVCGDYDSDVFLNSRRKRSLHEECCERVCTLEDIQTYC